MGWTCVLAPWSKPFSYFPLVPFVNFKIKKMRELRLFFPSRLLSSLHFTSRFFFVRIALVFIISIEMHKVFRKSCWLDLFVAKGREWMVVNGSEWKWSGIEQGMGRAEGSGDCESLPRCSLGFSWGISVVSSTFCLCYTWFCLPLPLPWPFPNFVYPLYQLSSYFSFCRSWLDFTLPLALAWNLLWCVCAFWGQRFVSLRVRKARQSFSCG